MRRFAVLCLLALPLAAQATTPVPLASLKDYSGLVAALKANGVNPVAVGWKPIEAACLSLKTSKDHIPYNKCRLNLATYQSYFRTDDAVCTDAGKAAYPASLSRPRKTAFTGKDGDDTVHITVNESKELNALEVRSGRAVTYNSCMRERGWIDPSNWQRGRE